MWSQPFFFKESCYLATNIWKKIRGKIRSEKNEGWGCVGWGGGRGINKTGYNVLPVLNMLNVSLHCFGKQN